MRSRPGTSHSLICRSTAWSERLEWRESSKTPLQRYNQGVSRQVASPRLCLRHPIHILPFAKQCWPFLIVDGHLNERRVEPRRV